MKASLPLEEFLPYRLVRASELVSRRFAARYQAAYGISRPEWRTFAILGQLGHTTATEIGRRSTMHKTKVSRAVAALEKRGWLSRRADVADRRIEHLELSASGAAVYAELAAMARDFQAALREEIGADAAAALEAGLAAVEARFVSLEAAEDE